MSEIYTNSLDQFVIQNILDNCNEDDIIILPEGECTWDGNITQTNSLEIRKQIILKGAGIDKTIINRNILGKIIYVNVTDKSFGISGVTLQSNDTNVVGVDLHGSPKNFHIWGNKFHKGNRGIYAFGYIYGLIDHNIFIDNFIEGVGIQGDDSAGWDRESTYLSTYGDNLGHPEFIFVENNSFIWTGNEQIDPSAHAIASNHGARYIFRNNNLNAAYVPGLCYVGAMVDVHGNYSYGRGTVAFEIYNNRIYSEHSYRGIHVRGGTGVVFNNDLIGDFDFPIHFNNVRSWTTPSGETSGGCPIGSDDPYYCSGDYPCIDQINNLYLWNNTYNGVNENAIVYNRAYVPIHVQEDRDFFHAKRNPYMPYEYPHPLTLITGIEKEFVINNTLGVNLELTETPNMIFRSGDVADFIINENTLSQTIADGETSSFFIRFQPLSIGQKTMTITIPNTDTNNNPYTITLTGNGIAEQEINLEIDFQNIVHNGIYNFGDVIIN